MPPRNVTEMTPEEREAKVAALKPAWAQDYIRQLERLTRTLHDQLTGAQDRLRAAYGPDGGGWIPPDSGQPENPGLPGPSEDYATARVYRHDDLDKPIADLPEHAEVVYADTFRVRYVTWGDHGHRALIVTGEDTDLAVHPVAPYHVLIAKG